MKVLIISITFVIIFCGLAANTFSDNNPIPDNIRHLVRENDEEVISKRSLHTKIFSNDGGSFRAVISIAPMHYKDENDEWKNIEDRKILAKSTTYFEDQTGDRANPEYHWYSNPGYYTQICNDYRLGTTTTPSDTCTSRLLPEFDLSGVSTPVSSVSNAQVSFKPDRSMEANVFACGDVTVQPTDNTTYSHQDHYESVDSNELIDTLSLDFDGDPECITYDLTSAEMTIIKNRCGDEDWYAVGYRFSVENTSNYALLDEMDHTLSFDYTTARKIAVKPKISNSLSVYPNPFNPVTTIKYDLEYASDVTLDVYGLNGQKVGTLVNGHIGRGSHAVTFDGSDLASGVYLYLFRSNRFNKTGKMQLVK